MVVVGEGAVGWRVERRGGEVCRRLCNRNLFSPFETGTATQQVNKSRLKKR